MAGPPVADFDASPRLCVVGQTIYFQDLSSEFPTSWRWFIGGLEFSGAQNPSYVTTGVGTFTITLRAANGYGFDDEVKVGYVTVSTALAPVAEFSMTPLTVHTGERVYPTDESTNTPTAWDWLFGNGVESTVQSPPAQTYLTAGSKNVELTVSNSEGEDTEIKTGYITVTSAMSVTYPASLSLAYEEVVTVTVTLVNVSDHSLGPVLLTLSNVSTVLAFVAGTVYIDGVLQPDASPLTGIPVAGILGPAASKAITFQMQGNAGGVAEAHLDVGFDHVAELS